MHEVGTIIGIRQQSEGLDLLVHVNNQSVGAVIRTKQARTVELEVNDGRTITVMQRKKAYATLKDIALYTGYLPEECKEVMKYYYMEKTGHDYFSLRDCSEDRARDFINCLIDFCLEHAIMCSESLLERTDDINTYLWQCLEHRRCCVCGDKGEVHHWDAIGMGNNRNYYDDTNNKKCCLCRKHHTIAHQKGRIDFSRDYHVYGVEYTEQ